MGRDGKGTTTIALATCLALAAVLWLPAAVFGGPLITDNFNKAPGADLGATETRQWRPYDDLGRRQAGSRRDDGLPGRPISDRVADPGL